MSLVLECEEGGPMNLSVRHHERLLFPGPRARVVFARLGAISVKRRVRALCAVAIDLREGEGSGTWARLWWPASKTAALAERIVVVWAANETCSLCGTVSNRPAFNQAHGLGRAVRARLS
jgi:hypothetical protein